MNRKTIALTCSIFLLIALVGVSTAVAANSRGKAKTVSTRKKAAVKNLAMGQSAVTAHQRAGSQKPSVCKECHGSMTTDKTPWHRMHLNASPNDLTCSSCHKSVKTGQRNMAGKVLVDRTVCLKCHREKFVAYTSEHQRKDWIKVHRQLRASKTGGADIPTMEGLKLSYPNCFICHDRKELNFCGECHKAHPHNNNWINGQHGRQALKTNFDCLRCHEKNTWCSTECHEGVTLPHNIPKWSQFWRGDAEAPMWRQVHFQVVKDKGDRVCRKCHDSPRSLGTNQDFCMECHHAQFYKEFPDQLGSPWIDYAMKFVKNNGSSRCWQCHLPDFCVACHTTGQKPPPGKTFVVPDKG